MADEGDCDGAIELLTELLDKAPDAFTFRFRYGSTPSSSPLDDSLLILFSFT